MRNELIVKQTWWNRYWKWLLTIVLFISALIVIFFSSGLNTIASDLTIAYTDDVLFENAIQQINSNEKVNELLGNIKPLDKMAILEGQVAYSNNHKTVKASTRIIGTKGKAVLDISASKIRGQWSYQDIQVRIKKPKEQKQTIKIVPRD